MPRSMSQPWQVESLRVTAFPSSPITQPQDWWERLVGSPPIERNSKPREGVSLDVGPVSLDGVDSSQLNLQVGALRIDWLLQHAPLSPEDDAPKAIDIIGVYPDVVGSFQTLVSDWFESCPDLTRLGFGAVLHQPVTDVATGYKVLGDLIPLKLDGTESDLSYRINRPRTLNLGDQPQRLNRLSTWSVERRQTVVFQVAGSTNGPVNQSTTVENQTTSSRLELDCSNGQQNEPLPQKELVKLFGILVDSAMEIAEQGDIP